MNTLFSYSLLSVIRERSTNITSLLDIFKEYCETIISIEGFKGSGRLIDIKNLFKKYGIDIPVPTLKTILFKIKDTHKDSFTLYGDYAFEYKNETFFHNAKEITTLNESIEELEFVYKKLCIDSGIVSDSTLQYFVDFNKETIIPMSLKYLKNCF
jgi:hypothetical protein